MKRNQLARSSAPKRARSRPAGGRKTPPRSAKDPAAPATAARCRRRQRTTWPLPACSLLRQHLQLGAGHAPVVLVRTSLCRGDSPQIAQAAISAANALSCELGHAACPGLPGGAAFHDISSRRAGPSPCRHVPLVKKGPQLPGPAAVDDGPAGAAGWRGAHQASVTAARRRFPSSPACRGNSAGRPGACCGSRCSRNAPTRRSPEARSG